MATLAANYPTLLDLAQRADPDGKIATIAEILNQTNEILDDMVWVEGNLTTGHKTTVRTGIPNATWRKMYGRVQPVKSTTAQITDSCGMLEAYSQIDKALADLNGNSAEWRLTEDRAILEGMSQEMASTLFYGNESTEPEAFTGLAPRFNSLSAENADNIIVGGGSGADNASIWLVVWSETSCHGIVPKGSTAGLQMEDLGRSTSETSDGLMEVLRSHYRWDAGLTVRDWRQIVRIPNIDKSELTADASSGANLPNLMFEALERVHNLGMGRPVFYMSRDIRTKVRQQLSAAVKQSVLDFQDVGGRRTMFFQEVPMRRCDVLAANEALVA